MYKFKKAIKYMGILIMIIILILVCFLIIKKITKEKGKNFSDTNSIKEEIKEENKKTAQLTFVGDFLFEEPYYEVLRQGENKDLYFSLVKPYFENDDISIGNMEVVIGNDTMEVSGTGYNFCAPESIGSLVASLDLEVLSTANNHAFDRGKAGIISTLDFFQNTDIMTVGTFKEKNDREELKILEVNGIKFGFLAYTMSTNVKPNNEELYMVSYYKSPFTTIVTNEDKEVLANEITKIRKKVDVVIVMMHWGEEFTYELTSTQKELASYLNSLGVDIIIGNHSHNIQPMEWLGDKHKTLVYYSLGNFVSADYNITRTNETFNNAYQVGLLSQVIVTKENNQIQISKVTTEPIINYYDTNLRNFMLVPYHEYTTELERTHYRYTKNFNKNFINQLYETVIPKEFREA